MSFVARLKAMGAPKTEDAQYEEARNALKNSAIESAKYSASLNLLVKNIHEFAGILRRTSDNLSQWMTDDAPGDYPAISRQVAEFLTGFDELTDTAIARRIEPNFTAPFQRYESILYELNQLTAEREDACKDFDHKREIQKQLESGKKPNQSDVDKAKARADEAQEKYERLNMQFIQRVTIFTEERSTSLGNPFRAVLAILCKFSREIAPEEDGPFTHLDSLSIETDGGKPPEPSPNDDEAPPKSDEAPPPDEDEAPPPEKKEVPPPDEDEGPPPRNDEEGPPVPEKRELEEKSPAGNEDELLDPGPTGSGGDQSPTNDGGNTDGDFKSPFGDD
jgi:hypothetical protein